MKDAPDEHHGHFLALLQFRVQSGDTILVEHLQSAHRNALYTSKTIQNEVIDICGNVIRENISEKILVARFYSVMVDEATDAANNEQLTVSLRYVHPNNKNIEERFLAFSECVTGMSRKAMQIASFRFFLTGSYRVLTLLAKPMIVQEPWQGRITVLHHESKLFFQRLYIHTVLRLS